MEAQIIMHILNNNIRYDCSNYEVISTDEIQFNLASKPEDISGQIKLYSDDEEPILLASLDSSAYIITITEKSETEYILSLTTFISDEVSLENAKARKVNELEAVCQNTIYDGMDIQLSTGVRRFTLDNQDQLNLSGIGLKLLMGATQISWHIDDEEEHCEYFSSADALLIIGTLTSFKEYHITYFRDLRIYVRSFTNVNDVNNAYYGMPIPEEFKSQVLIDYEKQLSGGSTESTEDNASDENSSGNTETTIE